MEESGTPSLPLMRGSICVEGSRNASLPLMREVARRAGGRDFAAPFYLRCGKTEPGSLPQSAALTAPSSEGAEGWVSKACIVRGAKGWKRKPPTDEGGAPRSESEISMMAGGNHTLIQ